MKRMRIRRELRKLLKDSVAISWQRNRVSSIYEKYLCGKASLKEFEAEVEKLDILNNEMRTGIIYVYYKIDVSKQIDRKAKEEKARAQKVGQ